MELTSYSRYVRDLRDLMAALRAKPSDFESALVEVSIYRNGFAYRMSEKLSGGRLDGDTASGAIANGLWAQSPKTNFLAEMHRFFELQEYHAYCDAALVGNCTHFSAAHWDGTVAAFDVSYKRRNRSTLTQRMLFIGFEDPIHAEFSAAIDKELLVHDRETGHHLYEWRLATSTSEATGRLAHRRRQPRLIDAAVVARSSNASGAIRPLTLSQ
jgi:hypothetical protein